jgi:hypothetical protein
MRETQLFYRLTEEFNYCNLISIMILEMASAEITFDDDRPELIGNPVS